MCNESFCWLSCLYQTCFCHNKSTTSYCFSLLFFWGQSYCFSLGSAIFSWQKRYCCSINIRGWVHGSVCFSQSWPLAKIMFNIEETKHIHIKYHVVREHEKNGDIQLRHCKGEEQLADILTKVLGEKMFENFRDQFGLIKKKTNECWVMSFL